MAEKLEGMVSNFIAGTVTGVVSVADPLGNIVSNADYWITGIGPADEERALPIFYNHSYQKFYENPKDDVSFINGYAPRAFGNVAGGIAGIAGYAGLYYIGGMTAALAIPGFFVLYCAFGTIPKYFKDLILGEEINNKYERAEFETGFSLGYHETTHLGIMQALHSLETKLTGRNLGDSHFYSSMVESGGKMRRNIGAVVGYGCGVITGIAVDVVSLGIVPLYKTVRDIIKNFTKTKKK